MLHADRELLARIARMNKDLAQCALPLANHTASQDELFALGEELIAVGRVLRDRAPLGVIDAEFSIPETRSPSDESETMPTGATRHTVPSAELRGKTP